MKKLYTIWDDKAEEFAPPFVAKNDKMASRMFMQSIKQVGYAEDFTLYCIGEFYPDDKLSPISNIGVRVVPIDGKDFE